MLLSLTTGCVRDAAIGGGKGEITGGHALLRGVLGRLKRGDSLTMTRSRSWVTVYKRPIYFFVAVAFWTLVGAGLIGFLINPLIALYYRQELNTTPVRGIARARHGARAVSPPRSARTARARNTLVLLNLPS